MRPHDLTLIRGTPAIRDARRGYTLFGLLLAITFLALVLGLVVAIRQLASRRMTLINLAVSADGRTIAAAFGDGRVRLFDVKTGRESTIMASKSILNESTRLAMALSPDGRYLATSAMVEVDAAGRTVAGPVMIFDTHSGATMHRMRRPELFVELRFSPSGEQLVVDGFEGTPISVDVRTGAQAPLLLRSAGKTPDFEEFRYAPDGSTIAAWRNFFRSPPATLELFDANDGEKRNVSRTFTTPILSHVTYSPDGLSLAACEEFLQQVGGRTVLTMMDATTLDVRGRIDLTSAGICDVEQVEFTADSRSIIALTDKRLYYIDASTVEPSGDFPRLLGDRIASSPATGTWALADKGVIRLYDSATREPTGVVWDCRESRWPIIAAVGSGFALWLVVFVVRIARGSGPRAGGPGATVPVVTTP